MSHTTEKLLDGIADKKHEVAANLKHEEKECAKTFNEFSKDLSGDLNKLGQKADGLVKRNSYKFIAAGFAGGALTLFGLQTMFRSGKARAHTKSREK